MVECLLRVHIIDGDYLEMGIFPEMLGYIGHKVIQASGMSLKSRGTVGRGEGKQYSKECI